MWIIILKHSTTLMHNLCSRRLCILMKQVPVGKRRIRRILLRMPFSHKLIDIKFNLSLDLILTSR